MADTGGAARPAEQDNEVLVQEVALLAAKLRQLENEAEVLRETNHSLLRERDASEVAAESQLRLLSAMEESLEQARAQHTSEREYLSGIFRELEAQLALARAEREELQSRSERELRAATRRQHELEEEIARLTLEHDRARSEDDVRRRGMRQAFERQLAATRLQFEEAQADKGMLRRLERDMAELREISASMLQMDARVTFDGFLPDGDRAFHCRGTTGQAISRGGRGLASTSSVA